MAYTAGRTSEERKKTANSIQQKHAIVSSQNPTMIGSYFFRYMKARGTKSHVSIQTLVVKEPLIKSRGAYILRAIVLLKLIKHNLDFIELDGFAQITTKDVEDIKLAFSKLNGTLTQTQFNLAKLSEDELKKTILNNIQDDNSTLTGNITLFNNLLKEIEDCKALDEKTLADIKQRLDTLKQRSAAIASRIQHGKINIDPSIDCAANSSPVSVFHPV